MVPRRGLEPPLPEENYDLNVARLPIPPSGHYIYDRIYLTALKKSNSFIIIIEPSAKGLFLLHSNTSLMLMIAS